MQYYNIPKNWWEYAVTHACNVLNMTSTTAINNKTPDFAWFRKVPDISKLKIWEYLAFAHKDGRKLLKLELRTTFCMYIGHFSDENGWKLIN